MSGWLGVLVVLILTIGVVLARAGKFTWHRRTQTLGVALSVFVAIGLMAVPTLVGIVATSATTTPSGRPVFVAVHAVLGAVAVTAGVLVVLRVTGRGGKDLRPDQYKLHMRTTYVLYLCAITLGLAIHWALTP